MFRKRMLAFTIDFIIFSILFMMFNIIPIYDDYFLHGQSFGRTVYVVYGFSLVLCIIIFVGKDIIKGKSIGKRIVKIKVVDMKGNTPNVFQLLLRNITIFIWYIELALLLIGKKKLGDVLAKTDVVVDK